MNSALPNVREIPYDRVAIHALELQSTDEYESVRCEFCSIEDAGRIVTLLASLRVNDQARCHMPAFRVELWRADEVVFGAAICWTCNNMELSGSSADASWACFDAAGIEAQKLLALCKTIAEGGRL